jgi:hypothetical protein
MNALNRCRSTGCVSGVLIALAGCSAAPSNEDLTTSNFEVRAAVAHGESAPLRDLANQGWTRWDPDQRERHAARPLPDTFSNDADTAIQASATSAAPALASSYEGIFAGEATGLRFAPPDTVGAVGGAFYVQAVNDGLAVYDKATGTRLLIVPTNALWKGFGGGCEANNDGDPTVNYDVLANRFIIAQFSVSTSPFLQCVAVSATADPTGSYHLYAFDQPGGLFPDYPKLAVWPDAYYETFNMFTANFAGAKVCAYDRAAMLVGGAASQQCFQLSSSFGGLLASHLLSSSGAPPAGSPNYVLNFGSNRLNLWKFHVDWGNPAATTFTGPTVIPVASFSTPRKGVPQPATRQLLDTLGDRLMYRLGYRNFGDHESLVANHSVATNRSIGVRWYELRNLGGTAVVYQQSTFNPDATFRWMGSVAMDKQGNLAVGYSASSSTVRPSIRFSGRLAGDPLNTLQAETALFDGVGSQLKNLARWGDYSSMSVDPTDDCTFFYTNEYLPADGTFNWHTRIGQFKFPGCL